MANRSCGQNRQARAVPVRQTAPAESNTEPVVHRWPHPVSGTEPPRVSDPTLYYIRCALSYQNQLLADIKTLLEQLTEAQKAEASSHET
ncbi:hypothetical protein [Oscillibacter sp.]|uniref:hypothetical protein n=1 Tax=Oscillibacter sp. TaxID=1945593 RepID=UPI00260F8928|nr:hypothetical protein [Oscillibacter sp.]MDD3346168.1 hypothetical protein [Oscillibacter sp.]